MADIATLNLVVNSDSVKQATAELKTFEKSTTAADRAAQKWGMTNTAAARSSDDFSKRVRTTIRDLEFERQQLSRSAAERQKYAILKRAGVSEASAEGRAIMASVAALQAQKAAHGQVGTVAKSAGSAVAGLVGSLKTLALAYVSVEAAMSLWNTAMKAADLGEQAEQVGVNTDQLQAYRLAAAQAGIESGQMDVALTKLAKSMGTAAEGNKEMIERFTQLGVKLLDAQGELRPTADVLPEVAKGILGIGSSSQRTAVLMDIFGKSGAKMATVLEVLAKGNDAVIASAREQNAIISPAAIAAWDELADRMKVTEVRWNALVGEFGAKFALPLLDDLNKFLATTKQEIEGIIGAWNQLKAVMKATRESAPVVTAQNDASLIQEQLAAQRGLLAINPNNKMAASSVAALEARLAAAQAAVAAQQSVVQLRQQGELQGQGVPSSSVSAFLPQTPLGVTKTGTVGVGSPSAKGSGDAAQKMIDDVKAYIAAKNAETAAVGQSAEVAARMTHETALLNKATEAKIAITPTVTAQIKEWAAAMAEADTKLKTAKFMDDQNTAAEQFIETQRIELETLFMSTEAAMAYRLEQEALNKAKAEGIVLSDAQKQSVTELANAQAAAAAKTQQVKELVDLGRETFRGFFSDFANGLREGQSAWDAFGNAATNALNKIADKLIDMAVSQLFDSAFGGSKGGGGGFLSGIFGSLFGGGMSSAGQPGSPYYGPIAPSAMGNAFAGGNIIPFARGGIVNRPTLFPMANGAGLMGEAGPEAVMPLRRRNGRLGVDASGAGAGGTVVNIYNNAEGTKATARESRTPGGGMQVDIIVEAVEAKMSNRLSRGQGSLGRTMEGTYGLQRQGR